MMKKSVAFFFIIVGIAALALTIGRARANPGALDPTGGDEGVAGGRLSENGEGLAAGQLDADGRVVGAGWGNG